MEKPGEVEKFKPTHPVVFVVPCKKAEELSGLDLKGSLTVLKVLLALHLSKTPYDLVLASECTHENFETGCFYICVDESFTNNSLKVLPQSLIHHRPSDTILFEPSAMVRFIFNDRSAINHRIQAVLDRIVGYCESVGFSQKSSEIAHELVNEINKNFSNVSFSGCIELILLFI